MKQKILGGINLLYVPISLLFIDIVFRIGMNMKFDFLPMHLLFNISISFLFAFICNAFTKKVSSILTGISVFFIGLVYYVEVLCKTSTACYYQLFSSFNMLSENRIFQDYFPVVLKSLLHTIPMLILIFVPFIVFIVLCKKDKFYPLKRKFFNVAFLLIAILAHCFAMMSMDLYKEEALPPAELYGMDIEIEEQIREFGLLTMLRLDVQHCLFGTNNNHDINHDDLENIKDLTSSESTESASSESSTESSDVPSEENTEVVEPWRGQYNELDIVFEESNNDSVNWLNTYFSSLKPTNKNKYTGMFKDYNVIFITAEGFSGYMIDKELTPTLYKLTHEGFVFNNFYTPLHYTSTTGGECQNLLGLYPKNGEPKVLSYTGDNKLSMPFTLANKLNEQGYTSIGYHFNVDMYNRQKSHPVLGYDWRDDDYLDLELNQYGNNVWPQSDLYMFIETIDEYIDMQPFNIYYMTISGHMPYSTMGNTMTYVNWEMVENLDYSEEAKSYIAANLELEKGLTYLIDTLEEKGILDNTLIVMAPDHVPYFDIKTLEELAGKTFGDEGKLEYLDESDLDFDVYKNSLIMWSSSMEEPVIVDKVCDQVDILPTVLNLMGVDYDSRLLGGEDILSDSEGLVIFNSRCWISDSGFYNKYTKEFIPNKKVSDKYVDTMNTLVSYKLKSTILIMETDYYSSLNIKESSS